MDHTSLRYEKTGRVGVMTFDTPATLNAISEVRLREMELLLSEIEVDAELGALVLTGGDGKAFCVGLDLGLLDRAFADSLYFETMVRRLNMVVMRLEALSVPTIAAVNGTVRAGGLELALACDLLLIADEARWGDVHTDAGMLPASSSLRLKRRIGEQRAKELIWSARWCTSAEAVASGLALRSVPRAELHAEALALASSMTDKPRAVLAASKRVFQRGVDAGLADGVELELRNFVEFIDREPYGRAAYSAFRAGRTAAGKS